MSSNSILLTRFTVYEETTGTHFTSRDKYRVSFKKLSVKTRLAFKYGLWTSFKDWEIPVQQKRASIETSKVPYYGQVYKTSEKTLRCKYWMSGYITCSHGNGTLKIRVSYKL